MEIVLYYNKSESNRVNKVIDEITTINGDFRDSVSILSPNILVRIDDISRVNYLYVEDLKRYYFITSIEIVRTGMYLFKCAIDVLMTWKEEILQQSAYIFRNEFEYNPEIVDTNIVFDSGFDYETFVINDEGRIKFEGYNADSENIIINALTSVGGTLTVE